MNRKELKMGQPKKKKEIHEKERSFIEEENLEENGTEEKKKRKTKEPAETEAAESHVVIQGTDDPQFKWYVAHVTSGFEYRVVKSLKEAIYLHGLESSFSEILIPEEDVLKNIGGKKRKMKRKFFPGYVLIKMVMGDRTWRLVCGTDKVSGFLGSDRFSPTPVSSQEITFLAGQLVRGVRDVKLRAGLSEGDTVKVIEGPFSSFVGTVEAVNEKGRVKVNVSIFGRLTPVELDLSQVEKVS